MGLTFVETTLRLAELDIEFQGRRIPTIVILGGPRDPSLLGSSSLEGLRLHVDPVSRKVRRQRTFSRAPSPSPTPTGPVGVASS